MIPIHIRVLRHSAFYTPLLLTMSAGCLAEQGLQAEYDIATAANTVEAGLCSGEVQVAQSAVATGFAGLAAGLSSPIRHFAQINDRDGFFLSCRDRSEDFIWSHLLDKQLLIDHFFQPLAMFRYACHLKDMDFAQLQVVDAGDVDAIDSAFRRGQGDVVHQQGPYAQQLEHDALGKVVASVGEVIGPVAFSSLCATPAWLQTDLAHAFYAAYCQGRRLAVELPAARIAELEAEFFPNIDRIVLTQTIEAYQRLGCWQGEHAITPESFEKTLDVFLYSGDITGRFAYSDLVCAAPE